MASNGRKEVGVPEDFEVVAPEEALARAARSWRLAAAALAAAGSRLDGASLAPDALGPAYHPGSAGWADAYHECLLAVRAALADSAARLQATAADLTRSARDYLAGEDELASRWAGLGADGERP